MQLFVPTYKRLVPELLRAALDWPGLTESEAYKIK